MGSLMWTLICGRYIWATTYRYVVRFLFFYAANTPVLRTTSPMVGCSRHVAWLEVHEHPSAAVNDVHRTASTVRMTAN